MITAGKKIVVNNNDPLDPDLILQIGMPFTCSEQRYGPVTDVTSFCQSNATENYRPEDRGMDRIIINSINPNRFNSLSIFPNPSYSDIRINYSLAEEENISISIINILGSMMKVLMTDTYQSAGDHSIEFNISDLPAGVYFISMSANGTNITKPFAILK